MPVTTIRLSEAEKRRFTAEARRRGISLSEYLRQSAQAKTNTTDWKSFFADTPPAHLPPGADRDLSTREGFTG
jgi:hypothetical protein